MRAGAAREMILVMPNAMNAYGGSMYSNSVTAGNWEGYIADDLVAYMDQQLPHDYPHVTAAGSLVTRWAATGRCGSG